MKEIIKTGFAWARYNRERIRWRPRNLQFDSLTASEKKQVDRLWGGVWTKPSYRWHEHYKSVNGKFDARYLPCDVFYLDVLPKLSNLKLAAAWEDKSYYSERFPDIPFPKLLNRPDFTGGSKFEKMEPLWKSKKESVTPKKSETKRFGWSMSTKASTLRSGLASSRLPRSSV